MRAIDGDALKERYENHRKLYCKNRIEFKLLSEKDKARVDELDNCIADILNAPTIEPEQRWIPCSEGLPEVHETGNSFSGVYMQSYPVLVYGVPEGEEECGFHVVTYCDDLNGYTYWATELDAVTIDGVRAWMPLPEPYAERREE